MQYFLKNFESIGLRVAIILLCFVLQGQAVTTNSTPLFKLSDVVPEGKYELELMTLQYSERAVELTAKIQQAAAADRDWFRDYVKNAPEGPLPYDERLGLTKEEYAEYLDALKKRQLVSTKAKVPCWFQRNEDALSLYIGVTDSPLNKIKLNLKTGKLTASVGDIGTPEWISNDGSSGVFGAYDGCAWTFQKADMAKFDIRMVKLEILRQKPSGKIIWHFQDSEVVKKERTQSFEVIFQPIPAPKTAPVDSPADTESQQSLKRLEKVFKICATIWACAWIVAGIAALASALLCFFPRTLQKALLLGQVGVWLGAVALLAAVIVMGIITSKEDLSRNTNGDNLSLIMMTASAPLLAFITSRWSSKKLKAAKDALTAN